MNEVGENPELGGGADDHHYQPEVELGFGPVVFAPAFRDADDFGRHGEGGGGGREEEGEGGGRASRIGRPCMSLRRKERCPDPASLVVERTLVMRWALFASCRGRSCFGRFSTFALQLYPGCCFSVQQAQTTLS